MKAVAEAKENEFKCPVCPKSAKSKLGLFSHMRTHTKEEPSTLVSEIKNLPKLDVKTTVPVNDSPTWVKKNGKKTTDLKPCIVIDKFGQWNENVMVKLGNMNVMPFIWGYYGRRFPVLVEKGDKLVPYVHSDSVGESCQRLYKAGHPDGFKNTFKHQSSLLQKIQIGLMAIIVIAIFFLIYILINR